MTSHRLAAPSWILVATVCCGAGCQSPPSPRGATAAAAEQAPSTRPTEPPAQSAQPAPRPPTQPSADAALRHAYTRSLKPSLRINQWRDDCDLQGAVHSDVPSPVDLELRIFVCADGREWELPRLTAAAGEPVNHYFEIDVERLPGFAERVRDDPRVSVVIRPPPEAAPPDGSGEVRFSKVIVGWEHY